MSKKANKTQAKAEKSAKTEKLVPCTLKKNGYINGELVKAGETVKIPETLKRHLVTTSPEVYQ